MPESVTVETVRLTGWMSFEDGATLNAHGIAGNLRGFYVGDTEKYLRQMIAAGVVSEAPAAWDFESLWVTLS